MLTEGDKHSCPYNSHGFPELGVQKVKKEEQKLILLRKE